MSDEQNETEAVSEELVGEIDQAIEEITVISEGSEETIEVPGSEETPETSEETAKEDTPQETQEDTQKSEDTHEDSEEDTPTDTPEETVEEPVSLSQESIARAMGNGLTYSEASSFGSETELNEFSGRLEYTAQVQQAREQQGQQQQQQPEVVDPFADLPKLDPDEHGSEIVGMFDRLTGIVKGQYETIQGFQSNQQQFQEHYLATSQAANQGEIEEWFDGEVEKLGDDFKDVLGSGKYKNLNQGSPEFQNRDAIANHMSVMLAGYKAQGREAPARSEIFDVAARQVLADKFSDIRNNKLSDELKKQSGQHIQRANKSTSTVVKTPDEEDAELAELLDSKFS